MAAERDLVHLVPPAGAGTLSRTGTGVIQSFVYALYKPSRTSLCTSYTHMKNERERALGSCKGMRAVQTNVRMGRKAEAKAQAKRISSSPSHPQRGTVTEL